MTTRRDFIKYFSATAGLATVATIPHLALANIGSLPADINNYCLGVKQAKSQLNGNSSADSMAASVNGILAAEDRVYNGLEALDLDSLTPAEVSKMKAAATKFKKCENDLLGFANKFLDLLEKLEGQGGNGPLIKQTRRQMQKSNKRALKKLISDILNY